MSSGLNRYNLGLFNSGTYSPHIEDISSISQATQAVVQTDEDHSFVIGNQVQFFIPPQYGMRQLNNLKGYVINVPASNQIVVDIDTTTFSAFTIPTPPTYVVYNPAQVTAIGDINTGTQNPGGVVPNPNTIPGAFKNQFP